MKKILKDFSYKPMGNEGSSLAIALFFFLLCSILCASMLSMGLSQINSAHTLISSSDNLDVNSINPAVRTMVLRYMEQIKSSGVRYYPELNKVNKHSDVPIGIAVEDLCSIVHETGDTASRTLTIVFDDVSSDSSLPRLPDGRYGFDLIIMMGTDYNISFCVYGNSFEVVRIAHIDSVSSETEGDDDEDDTDDEENPEQDALYIEWC